MNIISELSFKSLTKWSRLLVVLSLLVGLFVPLSLVQAGAEPETQLSILQYLIQRFVCLKPGLIEATVVISIPGGGSGKLETDWYISNHLLVHQYIIMPLLRSMTVM